MNARNFRFLSAGLSAVLMMAACSPTAKTPPAPPPPEVLVAAPAQRDVPISREWLATLDGSANVVVRPRVQGYLTKILYSPGSEVKEGEVMFEIDSRPFVAALEQAEAALAQAQAYQVKAELDANRQVGLFATKAVSEQDRDAAVQNNEAAKANVQAAKAAVELAKINLEFTKITAPVTGVAGIANPGIGDLVGPTGAELAKISTVNPIKAIFQISEQEYMRGEKLLNVAMATPLAERTEDLDLYLADGVKFGHRGKFLTADRQVDSKTGTLAIEALFPNPGNVLRPGIFARIRAGTRTEKDALLVPQRAVTEVQGQYHLVIIGEGDKAEVRPVIVGDRVGSEWMITKGLKPGERVVVEGLQKARPGTVVVPKPWIPPAPPAPAAPPSDPAKPVNQPAAPASAP
jgi:membrane fusion protein, multidrug efflux system